MQTGAEKLLMIAGPCAVESEEQIHTIAAAVAKAGATVLRGGAFKPRTSPYSFQGLGELGLRYLKEAAAAHGLLTISEALDLDVVDLVAEYVDIVQVGSRSMQHFSLLKKLGTLRKPVLLKRGAAATYRDLLMAAEYLIAGGNEQVILCERGIRTFETHTRNTLDLTAVPALQELGRFPVIVDPSHGTGLRRYVAQMACAAVAAGADGLIVEVHSDPDEALSDGQQSLNLAEFSALMERLKPFAQAAGRAFETRNILESSLVP